MKKFSMIILAVVFIATINSCSEKKELGDIWNGYDRFASNKASAKLFANSKEIGSVKYGVEQIGQYGYLTATYQIKNGWEMEESQVYVGSRDKVPAYDPENPRLKRFPFVEYHAPRVTTYTQYIPCNKLPAISPGIDVAVQAYIKNLEGEAAMAFADDDGNLLTKL